MKRSLIVSAWIALTTMWVCAILFPIYQKDNYTLPNEMSEALITLRNDFLTARQTLDPEIEESLLSRKDEVMIAGLPVIKTPPWLFWAESMRVVEYKTITKAMLLTIVITPILILAFTLVRLPAKNIRLFGPILCVSAPIMAEGLWLAGMICGLIAVLLGELVLGAIHLTKKYWTT